MKKLLAGILLMGTINAFGSLPDYNRPELLARANLFDGYNLPPLTFFNNTYPVINDRGDVVFKLAGVDGTPNHALWVKKAEEKSGSIVYVAPDYLLLSEPSLNGKGKIAFSLFEMGYTEGIHTYNIDDQKVEHVLKTEVDKSIAYFTYPQVLSDDRIFFRGTNQENERAYYSFDGKLNTLVKEGTSVFGQKTSYLFKPSVNDSGTIAFKRRVGETGDWGERNPDEIILQELNAKGESINTVIARDIDADKNSVFVSFANGVSLSNNGLITFVATLKTGPKAIILYKNGILKNLVTEKTEDLSEIELFDPKVNEQGQVIFRGKDFAGKRSLYLADEDGVKKLISESDEVMTDIGIAKILHNPVYPGFGGNVDINSKGEIVFYCLLVSLKDDKELGSGVYLMTPTKK